MPFFFDQVSAFWSKVDRSGGPDACWPWLAGEYGNGYGVVKWNGKCRGAHRVALGLELGREVHKGMDACHRCNNRRCCNPGHLYEGTRKQNVADQIAAGTLHNPKTGWQAGEKHSHRISADLALVIYRRAVAGESYADIATDYADLGVTRNTVKDIKNGRSWTSVTGVVSRRRSEG